MGVSAVCWSIWSCSNNLGFDKKKASNFLQVILQATHWIHTWSLLHQTDAPDSLEFGCNRLKTVAQDFFNRFGWHINNRLGEWFYSSLLYFWDVITETCMIFICSIILRMCASIDRGQRHALLFGKKGMPYDKKGDKSTLSLGMPYCKRRTGQ